MEGEDLTATCWVQFWDASASVDGASISTRPLGSDKFALFLILMFAGQWMKNHVSFIMKREKHRLGSDESN